MAVSYKQHRSIRFRLVLGRDVEDLYVTAPRVDLRRMAAQMRSNSTVHTTCIRDHIAHVETGSVVALIGVGW